MNRYTKTKLDHWITTILLGSIFLFLILGAGKQNIQFGRSYLNLSETTRNTISDLSDPLYITYYSTPGTIPPKSEYQGLAERVKNVLSRYEDISNGQIKVELKNPSEDGKITDDVRNKMRKKGIPPQQASIVRGGQRNTYQFYSAIDITYRTVDRIIPKVDNLQSLEYELTKAIKHAKNPSLVRIGLYVPPVTTMSRRKGKSTRADESSFSDLETELNDIGIVKRLDPLKKGDHFPDPRKDETIDVLIVAAKRKVAKHTRYALDQYLMRGGKAIVAVDPVGYKPQRGGMAMMRGSGEELDLIDSGLGDLLNHYGIKTHDHIVLDQSDVVIRLPQKFERRSGTRRYGIRRNVKGPINSFYGLKGGFRASNPPFLLSIGEDLLTFHPTSINPGSKLEEDEKRTFEPWLSTSNKSTTLNASELRNMVNQVKGSGFYGSRNVGLIQVLISSTLNYYSDITREDLSPPEFQSRPIAGLRSGSFSSFYSPNEIPDAYLEKTDQANGKNGKKNSGENQNSDQKQNGGNDREETEKTDPDFRKEGSSKLVVMGDTDLLNLQLTSAVRSNYLDNPEGGENSEFAKRTVEFLGNEMKDLQKMHAGRVQSAYLRSLNEGERRLFIILFLLLGPVLFMFYGSFRLVTRA